MTTRSYATPEAFKQALEQRVRSSAGASGMGRFRQVLVFDRFLARLFAHFGERAVAKGGVVLELRLERARTTRDVDIRLTGSSDDLLLEIQRAARLDLGDFMTFVVEADRDQPTIEGDGVIYKGRRFRVQGFLSGKVYAGSFGLDVGFADVMTEAPEIIDGSDFLAFAHAQCPHRHQAGMPCTSEWRRTTSSRGAISTRSSLPSANFWIHFSVAPLKRGRRARGAGAEVAPRRREIG